MVSSDIRTVFERLSDRHVGRWWWVVALFAAWGWGIPAAVLTRAAAPEASVFSVLVGLAVAVMVLQWTMLAVTSLALRAIGGGTEEGRKYDWSRIASLYTLQLGIGLGWFVAMILFLIEESPSLFSSASGSGWGGVAFTFALLVYISILLGLQTLQSRSRIEDATFQAVAATTSMPKVKVTVLMDGGRVSDETEARIRGIGQVCILRREDGFWESIRWKDIVRVAILPLGEA